MSTGVRLGPVSYLVLGLIAMRGPCTPYDLKRMVQLSVGNFWPFPHTQLYEEPKRLAQAGLLEETREETGRRRRHYAITEAGRRPLAEWLSEPVTTPTEYRDLGLLKFSPNSPRPRPCSRSRRKLSPSAHSSPATKRSSRASAAGRS